MLFLKNRSFTTYLVTSSMGLAFCLLPATLSAQQDQRDDMNGAPMQQDQQDPPEPGAPYGGPQQGAPEQVAPRSLTLPAGTVIRVRVNEWLSSDRNQPGDGFSAVLDQPIVVDGWVVARRGQPQNGTVSVAKKAGRGNGSSELGVELTDLTLVDGQQLPIQTQLLQSSAGSSAGRNAAVVGTTTGIGAIIGAAAGGGTGAAVGAIAGASAGMIGIMTTPGKPTVIFPETLLTFRLQSPVTISTEKSQFAFQPVGQGDYDSRPNGNNRPERSGNYGRPGYPPPPPPPYYGYPYAYAYPYPYGYYYPGPVVFGVYGGYGFGRGFGGYRGYRR